MKAFITGSHAYGTPNAESDLDLVLRVTPETRAKLIEVFTPEDVQYSEDILQFKVGNLNLILCVTDTQYAAWSNGTGCLVAMKPVTRDQAIAVLKPMLEVAKELDAKDVEKAQAAQ